MSPGFDDESRGNLKRAAAVVAAGERRSGRRKSWADVQFWQIPGATEFNGVRALTDPVVLIASLRASEAGGMLDDLIDLSVRPASREVGGRPWGRPRMDGRYDLAYLAYILSRSPGVQPWWTSMCSSPIWKICGFDRSPSYSQVHRQFVRLEAHWAAFALVAQELIRRARKYEPRIGDIIFVDGTQWITSSTLEHCCPAGTCTCPRPAGSSRSVGRDPVAALAAHWAEDEGPEPHESDPGERTRRDVRWFRDIRGVRRAYQMFFTNGCWYRSLDQTSGLRNYADTTAEWYGGYKQSAVDFLTGVALAVEVFPADVMEWDHYPQLFASIVAGRGEAPYVVSADRGYSINKFFEFNRRDPRRVRSTDRTTVGLTEVPVRTTVSGIPATPNNRDANAADRTARRR